MCGRVRRELVNEGRRAPEPERVRPANLGGSPRFASLYRMPAIGDVGLKVSEYTKDAVHAARRVHGFVNLRNERVEGIAAAAVLEAARASLRGRTTPAEAAWVHRIET